MHIAHEQFLLLAFSGQGEEEAAQDRFFKIFGSDAHAGNGTRLVGTLHLLLDPYGSLVKHAMDKGQDGGKSRLLLQFGKFLVRLLLHQVIDASF